MKLIPFHMGKKGGWGWVEDEVREGTEGESLAGRIEKVRSGGERITL